MKKILIPIVLALLVFTTSCKYFKRFTNKSNEKADTSYATKTGLSAAKNDSAAMMKNWMDYMTPGAMHQLLASFEGEWKGEITVWMSPDAPPTTAIGVCSNKMILGGRYQYSENKSNFGGMPFEGINTLGYDNAKKVFVSSWVDNMGTGIMNMEGTYDSIAKVITFKGKSVDPTTGTESNVKEIFRIIDKDHQLMEMFAVVEGKELKNMEIKYSRK